MKRVGIDARMMSPNFGIGRYIQQLLKHLKKINPKDIEFVLFLRSNNFNEFQASSKNFSKIKADIDWYGLEEQIKMPGKIKEADVDLMHFPHWNIPLIYNDPFVVTIHDLIMFHFPRPEATTRSKVIYWFKDKIHRFIVATAAKGAEQIITTSNFTKDDIVETLNINKNKIKVIYQAPFGSEKTAEDFSEVSRKYGIRKPYLLYVGSAYPHKNLKQLLKAWNKFKSEHDSDHQLTLVGSEDYFYKKLQESEEFINSEDVKITGKVRDEELLSLYQQACLFVYPSVYEGFGLPPLEALKQGTPTLSSDKSCLPEVLGEAAMYTNTTNTSQFAESIFESLKKESLRKETLNEAKRKLSGYSSEGLARKTLQVYREALK